MTYGSKEGSFNVEHTVVTVYLKLILAITSSGLFANGSVPKFQTMVPLFPALAGTIVGSE